MLRCFSLILFHISSLKTYFFPILVHALTCKSIGVAHYCSVILTLWYPPVVHKLFEINIIKLKLQQSRHFQPFSGINSYFSSFQALYSCFPKCMVKSILLTKNAVKIKYVCSPCLVLVVSWLEPGFWKETPNKPFGQIWMS